MAGEAVSHTLFDRILIVDWSSANSPKTGKDSIWIADSSGDTLNLSTREAAVQHMEDIIKKSQQSGGRLLIGWDFAFGYPFGFAKALGLQGWQSIWAWLHARIEDDARNRSNRFEVGAAMNRRLGTADGPFWGYVGRACPEGLSPYRHPSGNTNFPYPFNYLRHVEHTLRSASPVFKLAYPGSVGSQALLGIARLEGLRRAFPNQIAIWPFETQFGADLSKPVIFAEIYPSAHQVPDGPEVKDKRQVEAVLKDFLEWDEAGLLREKLDAPNLSGEVREAVQTEEGWVIGV